MLLVLSFLLFFLFPIIGFLRTIHGENRNRKCAEFSFIKWTLGGASLSLLFALLHSLKYGGGNITALTVVSIGLFIATIASMVIEKIILANIFKKEKIEDKKASDSNKWD